MKRLLVLAVLGVVTAACNRGTDGALRVEVATSDSPKFIATCFEVEVVSKGEVQASAAVTLVSGQRAYVLALKQGSLPATVTVRANAYLGDCADPATRKLASRSDPKEATFPEKGIETVPVTLGPPTADLDADRDGYIDSGKGGADCNDADDSIRPNTTQACGVATDTDCDGRVGCADPDCANQPECAHPPTMLVLTPATVTTQTGDCSGVITVETRDASGRQPVALPTRITLTGPAGVVFSSDACQTVATGLDLPTGGSTGTFRYRASQVGTGTITAHTDGLTDGTLTAVVNPFPAASLTFTASVPTVTAGDCSPDFTVQLLDTRGVATTTVNDLALELSSDQPTGVSFFAGTSCGTALPSPATLTIPAGQGRATFRMIGTRLVLMTLTARTVTNLSVTRDVTVVPGLPNKLAFSTGDPGMQVNTCSAGPVTVQLRDRYDNPTAALSDLTVALTAMSANFQFYSGGVCSIPVNDVVIPQGATSASVRVRATMVGSYTMHAASGSLTEGLQTATVASGPPVSINIDPHTPSASVASACSPTGVRLVTRDSSGAPSAPSPALDVGLSSTGQQVSFYGTADCDAGSVITSATVPTTSSETTFYYKSPRAQTFNILVDAGALGSVDSVAGYVIDAGVPWQLRWDAPFVVFADAGSCSQAFHFHLEDQSSNRASYSTAQTVTFSRSDAGVTFSSLPSCADAGLAMTLPAGQQTADVYALAQVTGTYGVVADIGAVAPVNTVELRVTPAGASQLLWAPAPATTAQAGDCLTATLERRDAYGNLAPVTAATNVTLLGGGAGVFEFYASANCTGAATGTVQMAALSPTVSFSMRGMVVNAYSLSATQGALTTSAAGVTIAPGNMATFRLLGVPSSADAGSCMAAVSVQREDAYANLTTAPTGSSLTVSMSGAGGDLFFFSDPSCTTGKATTLDVTIPAGMSSQQLSLYGTLAQPAVVTASATINSVLITRTANVSINAAAATQLVFTSLPGTVSAGACSPRLTMQARDPWGNPASPAVADQVNLTHTATGTFEFWSTTTCDAGTPITSVTIPSTGSTAGFSFKATIPQSVTITATGTNLSPPVTQDWVVDAGAAANLIWLAPPASNYGRFVCTNGISVQSQDVVGNVVNVASSTPLTLQSSAAAAGAVFFATSDCDGGAVPSASLAAGTSSATFSARFVGSGSTNVSISSALSGPPSQPVTVDATTQGALVVTTGAAPELEYAECQLVTVQRQDGAGNPVTYGTSSSVTVTAANSNLAVYTNSNCTTAGGTVIFGDGSATADVWVRGRGLSGTTLLTATDAWGGYAAGTLTITTVPLVRRGTCDLADTSATSSCVVSPAIPGNDISRTFLVFQASTNSVGATDSNVTCRLVSGADVRVQCKRFGTAGAVAVTWQTVSWGRAFSSGGVSVQRFNGQLTDTSANPFNIGVSAVTLNNAFLLFSSASVGTRNDAKDFPTARLQASNNVRLSNSVGWANALGATGGTTGTVGFEYDVQVVEMAGTGMQVDRNVRNNQAGATIQFNPPGTVTTAQTIVLSTASMNTATEATATAICKRRYRGAVTGATQLTFTRGSGTSGSCIDMNASEFAWERVQFPNGTVVRAPAGTGVAINNPSLTGDFTWTGAVVPERTVLLLSGQGPGGQCSGETQFNGGDNLGAVHATLTLVDPQTVRVARSGTTGSSDSNYTPMVVEFPQ